MLSPEHPLRDGAAVRWSRLKIATNVVGVICSPEPREPLIRLSQRKLWYCVLMGRSGYQQRSAWDLVQLRACVRGYQESIQLSGAYVTGQTS